MTLKQKFYCTFSLVFFVKKCCNLIHFLFRRNSENCLIWLGSCSTLICMELENVLKHLKLRFRFFENRARIFVFVNVEMKGSASFGQKPFVRQTFGRHTVWKRDLLAKMTGPLLSRWNLVLIKCLSAKKFLTKMQSSKWSTKFKYYIRVLKVK